jgi:hypothetical protein
MKAITTLLSAVLISALVSCSSPAPAPTTAPVVSGKEVKQVTPKKAKSKKK